MRTFFCFTLLFAAYGSTFTLVASAEPVPQWIKVFNVLGKDVRDVAKATPENPDPGKWILLGSSATYADAQKTLITITRHGGFVRLHIVEDKLDNRRAVGRTNPNLQVPPKTPAPTTLPRPKGILTAPSSSATPLAIKKLPQ